MQGHLVGFESSLQQHLDAEQRRAVLEAIGGSINPDSTLGEIIDAAEALGWSEKMGDLSLADLAEALLAPSGEAGAGAPQAVAAADDDDADDDAEEAADEDDEDEDEGFELEVQEPASRRKLGKAAAAKEAKTAAAKKKLAAASKKAASKKAAEAEPMRGSKKTAKKLASKPGRKAAEAPAPARSGRAAEKASPVAAKKTAKKAGRRKPAAVDVDDRMSLDEAAEFFLPVVEDLGEATMQALEEQTGVSRRKLRFHVGQLVKHGYLERHGMGRGTYYTRR